MIDTTATTIITNPTRNTRSSHSHALSFHAVVDWMGDTLFECGKAIDCAIHWVDHSHCSPAIKEGAVKVKGAVEKVNLVFSACATASATHHLLDDKNHSVGVAEVTSFIGSVTDFFCRLHDVGAAKLPGESFHALAGIGALADVLGGAKDCGVIWEGKHVKDSDSDGLSKAKKTNGYKFLKIAENVASIFLALFSGSAAYCAAFEVEAPKLLPFSLLVLGTSILSIRIVRFFYERLKDNGLSQRLNRQQRQPQNLNRGCNHSSVLLCRASTVRTDDPPVIGTIMLELVDSKSKKSRRKSCFRSRQKETRSKVAQKRDVNVASKGKNVLGGSISSIDSLKTAYG